MNKKQAKDMMRRANENAAAHIAQANRVLKKSKAPRKKKPGLTAAQRKNVLNRKPSFWERNRIRDQDQFGPSGIRRNCF